MSRVSHRPSTRPQYQTPGTRSPSMTPRSVHPTPPPYYHPTTSLSGEKVVEVVAVEEAVAEGDLEAAPPHPAVEAVHRHLPAEPAPPAAKLVQDQGLHDTMAEVTITPAVRQFPTRPAKRQQRDCSLAHCCFQLRLCFSCPASGYGAYIHTTFPTQSLSTMPAHRMLRPPTLSIRPSQYFACVRSSAFAAATRITTPHMSRI